MDHVKCPHCGKQVELSEAIIHELQDKIRSEQEKKLKAVFEEEKARETAKKEKELREEFEKANETNTKELIEAKKKEQILLQKMADDAEKRKADEEKLREEILKQASDKNRLEKLEYEKKISDMQKALEEAQRKGKQGSQQLQGEVLELDFEELLKNTFRGDEFLPIPKGVEGGDIWQKVKYNGKEMGSIIWETKRTKAWSKAWLTKLKEDAGKISATEAIIVSQTLPADISSFDRKEGVWITTYEHALSICRYVRFLITSVASAKSSANHSEEEWGMLRDYMMSDSFKHRMQAHFDGVKSLKDSLEAEKRSTTIRWKKQETQINKLDMNTTNFYGELKAIVVNLPELEEIEGALLTDGNSEDNSLI